MASRTRRFLFSLLLFFVVCGFLGTVVSQRLGAQSSTDESALRDDLRSFTNVYDLVEQNYAEPLTGEKAEKAVYDGAIPGMLRVLDPHSSFYDPKAYAKMREEQHGRYYGVGMTIVPQQNKIVVVYPTEGTPSYKAGVHPGDTIVSVDGKSADGMNADMVAKLLKGPKGTHVSLTVSRDGQSKPLSFDLVRDEIPHPSVDLKYEIRPGVGYIHLTQFQETTAREIDDAISSFGDAKGLVLDLRGNPGGLLSQAVEVCDHLLVVDRNAQGDDGQPLVVGTYRLTRDVDAARAGGFYTANEFDMSRMLAGHKGQKLLELGERSDRGLLDPAHRAGRGRLCGRAETCASRRGPDRRPRDTSAGHCARRQWARCGAGTRGRPWRHRRTGAGCCHGRRPRWSPTDRRRSGGRRPKTPRSRPPAR